MLRAIRFAARFTFSIEEQTLPRSRNMLRKFTPFLAERIRDELTKLLTEGAARLGFELLDESGLLQQLLPEISAMKGVEQPPQYHPEGDVWIHTRMMLEGLPAGISPALAWGVLLHDVGKPPTFRPASATGDRIRFDGHAEVGVPMADTRSVTACASPMTTPIRFIALVANHMKFKDVAHMRQSTLKRFVRQPRFAEHLELHRLDCCASHGRLDAYETVRKLLADTPAEQFRPARLLTGDDLQDMGYIPGTHFQRILTALEDAQLEGQLHTRDEAILFIRNDLSRDGKTADRDK